MVVCVEKLDKAPSVGRVGSGGVDSEVERQR